MTDVQARALRTASDLLGRELGLVDVFTGGQHATTLLATDGDSEFVVRAAGLFLEEYERLSCVTVGDIDAWDVQAAASAHDRVETWLPNYLGIGRVDMTADLLRERLDAWNARL